MKTGNLKCGNVGSMKAKPSAKLGGKQGNLREPMVGEKPHKARGSVGYDKTYGKPYTQGPKPGTKKFK